MEGAKKFDLNGWANVARDGFSMSFTSDHGFALKNIVCGAGDIDIYLSTNAMSKLSRPDSEWDTHHVVYSSTAVFTIHKICNFIIETLYKYVDDSCEGNDDSVSNLALTGFYFKDRKIYATFDS